MTNKKKATGCHGNHIRRAWQVCEARPGSGRRMGPQFFPPRRDLTLAGLRGCPTSRVQKAQQDPQPDCHAAENPWISFGFVFVFAHPPSSIAASINFAWG